MIVKALAPFAVPLDDLVEHPENPNVGDLEAIKHQLLTWGQHTPILVQESTGYVIAGNHRLRAARELGWTHLAAVRVDWDDEQAREVLVGDNLPGRRARTDEPTLAKVLGKLASAGRLEDSGYEPPDLADLLRNLDLADPEALRDEPSPEDFWPTVKVEVRHPVYSAWVALVREADAPPSAVFADLVLEASDG